MTMRLCVFRWLLSNLILATVPFGCGGPTAPLARIGYLVIFATAGAVTVLINNGSLAQERNQPGPGATDLGGCLLTSLLFLATVAVAALDRPLHLGAAVQWQWQIGAFTLLVPLAGLQTWAMAVNPFFSSAIRLQTERGHYLVTRGPYRFVRHPGYLAMLLTVPATAIALGSRFALLPVLSYSAVILRRTIKEDHFLKEELNGYTDYSAMVRHRLAPGLW